MIFNDWLIASAFITGLIGSVHCVGMCGGIVGALSLSSATATHPIPIRPSGVATRWSPLAYNAGRISSYSLAGAIAGLIGSGLFDATQLNRMTAIGGIIAGAFMIALGLYLAAWWRGLTRLENIGAKLWRKIEPLGRRLLPPRNIKQTFALGMLWGWLPCGMVYTALAAALASGAPVRGALVMCAFGLGTLPMLLTLSVGARSAWMASLRSGQSRWRPAIGIVLILLGAYGMLAAGLHEHHGTHIHTAARSE